MSPSARSSGTRLPTFLVIGAQKAGTSSLWRYLQSHPQVFMAPAKELNYFVAEREWDRGLDWYEAQFADAGDATAVGEASPLYTMHPLFAGVPERIASTLPGVRLVYLVRHPIHRLQSHYLHLVAEGEEQRPLSVALRENRLLVDYSLYAAQTEQYLRHFSTGDLLVVPSELLRHHREATLHRILEFVGVDPTVLPPTVDTEFHSSSEKRALRGAVRPLRTWPAARAMTHRLPASLRRSLRSLVSRPVADFDASLPPQVEAELVERFSDQVPLVRELVRRTWPDWDGWFNGRPAFRTASGPPPPAP